MRWHKDLYVGESLRKKTLYYKYILKYTKKVTGTYCILPASGKADLLDICHSELLKFDKFYPDDQIVVGIAGSRREAYDVAARIISDSIKETGSTDVKGYLGV